MAAAATRLHRCCRSTSDIIDRRRRENRAVARARATAKFTRLRSTTVARNVPHRSHRDESAVLQLLRVPLPLPFVRLSRRPRTVVIVFVFLRYFVVVVVVVIFLYCARCR